MAELPRLWSRTYLHFLSRSNVSRLCILRTQKTLPFSSSGEMDSPFLPAWWTNGSWVGSGSSVVPECQRGVLYFYLTWRIIITDSLSIVLNGQISCFSGKRFHGNLNFPDTIHPTLRARSLPASPTACLSSLCFYVWSYFLHSQPQPQNVWSGNSEWQLRLGNLTLAKAGVWPALPLLNAESKTPELQLQLYHRLSRWP